jgi:hypothetical protein
MAFSMSLIVVILHTFLKRGQGELTPVSDLFRNETARWNLRSPEGIHVIYMPALRGYREAWELSEALRDEAKTDVGNRAPILTSGSPFGA